MPRYSKGSEAKGKSKVESLVGKKQIVNQYGSLLAKNMYQPFPPAMFSSAPTPFFRNVFCINCRQSSVLFLIFTHTVGLLRYLLYKRYINVYIVAQVHFVLYLISTISKNIRQQKSHCVIYYNTIASLSAFKRKTRLLFL